MSQPVNLANPQVNFPRSAPEGDSESVLGSVTVICACTFSDVAFSSDPRSDDVCVGLDPFLAYVAADRLLGLLDVLRQAHTLYRHRLLLDHRPLLREGHLVFALGDTRPS